MAVAPVREARARGVLGRLAGMASATLAGLTGAARETVQGMAQALA